MSANEKKLENFLRHLGDTLFFENQNNFWPLTHVIERLRKEEKIDVIRPTKSKACRSVQVVCKQCRQYVHVEYGHHTTLQERQAGRDCILEFLRQQKQSGPPTV